MAAPFFITPESLLADLAALGYTDAREASIAASGAARLKTLSWLALQADPTFVASTADHLLRFWEHLGLQAGPPNPAGHCIPFTAPHDRPRDRAAAACFLRAAIDLVFAFRARRAENSDSNAWATGEQHDEDAPPLSKFDVEAFAQIDLLLTQRHILFPNTTKLFQTTASKRRPLQKRRDKSNNVAAIPRREKVGNNQVPSREHLLERLRTVQSNTQDLSAPLSENVHREDEHKDSVSLIDIKIDGMEEGEIKKLANDANVLNDLIERLSQESEEALARRNQTPDLAVRDEELEARVTALVLDCGKLEKEAQSTARETRRAKIAMEKLDRSRTILQGLPDSASVCEAMRLQHRTENNR